jgi:hypothetical protein
LRCLVSKIVKLVFIKRLNLIVNKIKYIQNILGIICGIVIIILIFFKPYLGDFYGLLRNIGDVCFILYILMFGLRFLKS